MTSYWFLHHPFRTTLRTHSYGTPLSGAGTSSGYCECTPASHTPSRCAFDRDAHGLGSNPTSALLWKHTATCLCSLQHIHTAKGHEALLMRSSLPAHTPRSFRAQPSIAKQPWSGCHHGRCRFFMPFPLAGHPSFCACGLPLLLPAGTRSLNLCFSRRYGGAGPAFSAGKMVGLGLVFSAAQTSPTNPLLRTFQRLPCGARRFPDLQTARSLSILECYSEAVHFSAHPCTLLRYMEACALLLGPAVLAIAPGRPHKTWLSSRAGVIISDARQVHSFACGGTRPAGRAACAPKTALFSYATHLPGGASTFH